MKRTETFVFEFDNQEVFKEFFDEYYYALPICGIKCLGVSTENLLEKEDDLVKLIGHLYDMAQENYLPESAKKQSLEKRKNY